ncbi:hypothetical protein [Pontibacter sp. G13]|uniref:hypothetical protein n=1 Tax=Pontibacter sp. G13 TaxID=3074898 RepID=UPI00288A9319|nr:hypothetical protein [Pontibacter sp. G13]WNJ18069.1 hypothetical protein RJD25_24700 [Pontibacter sp. G13]
MTGILKYVWAIMFAAIALTGCKPPETTDGFPIYLDLSNAKIAYDEAGNVIRTQGLKDVWIDHNGEDLGVFNLPNVVPVIPDENNRVTISGGIFNNGFSTQRAEYPFWAPITFDIEADPLDTVKVSPTFRYLADTIITFPFSEGFEGAANDFVNVATGDNTTSIFNYSRDQFIGNSCGKVDFNSTSYEFEVFSREFLALPQSGGNNIYLEFSYKNTIPFTCGIVSVSPNTGEINQIPADVYFLSEGTWNTAFIHINDAVRAVTQGSIFKIYFEATGKNSSTGEVSTGNLLLDNVRIVHYQ